jgi:DNA-binding CsgD family transcriptional regulator
MSVAKDEQILYYGGVSSRLVGRELELETLSRVVAAPPAVVLVEGEAGVGKTRLVTELASLPEVARRRVMVGACRRIREPFPLGPVLDAVRGLSDVLSEASLSPLAGSLRPLMPELADALPPQPSPLDDRAADRHRVFRALVEVLGAVGPTILVLEDLHWADDQTIDFLSYLLGAPPPGTSLVLTFRGEEVEPAVRAVSSTSPAAVRRAHIVLTPLNRAETGALAAAILGVEGVSDEFAAYLCERASGLPFAIEELLALLQAHGTVARRGGHWARRALEELNVPRRIRDQVLERVASLPADAIGVAEAAAVLHMPVELSVLSETSYGDRLRGLKGLDRALESGLLTERGGLVGFRHVLAAQAVYESLPAARRRELHRRAAAALEAIQPAPLGPVAHHLRHAGQPDAWAAAAERAADQASELGYVAEVARLLEDVLRHASLDSATRGRIAVKLGAAALEAPQARDVADLLWQVLEDDVPPAVRGELRYHLAVLLTHIGADVRVWRQLFADAVDELDGRPDLKAHSMICLGFPIVPGVPLSEHRSWLQRALDILPQVRNPSYEVFLLSKVAMVLVGIGDWEWRQLTDDVLKRTGGSPRTPVEVVAYQSIGMEACYAGHAGVADELLGLALQGVAAHETRKLELKIQSEIVLLDYCRGAWSGLGARLDDLLDACGDYALARGALDAVKGCLDLAEGELERAEAELEDVVERLEQQSAFDFLPFPATALIRLTLCRQDVSGALALSNRVIAAVESLELWVPGVRALPVLVEAMVLAGRTHEADALVARCAEKLGSLDAPLADAGLRHARGFLEVAAERWPAAALHFAAAADLHRGGGRPYEAAQAHECAASALFAAGSDEGEAALRASLADYEALGAMWDFSRAASTARRHGMSVPSRHRGGRHGYGDELSPREKQVAELVARGLRNKEIAEELFLSLNTVTTHVASVMRKLDVRSRTGVLQRLNELDAGSEPKDHKKLL